MMSRCLSAGYWLYQRAGAYAPAVGPLLWTLAMTSAALHSPALTLALSIAVLYYNVSISYALRRAVAGRDERIRELEDGSPG
jgi:hypothetical protein